MCCGCDGGARSSETVEVVVDGAIEIDSYQYEEAGACCDSVCMGTDPIAFGTPEYDLLNDCMREDYEVGDPTYSLIEEEGEYVCHGTWEVESTYQNSDNTATCTATREFVLGPESTYVDAIDCCRYLPDAAEEERARYLQACRVEQVNIHTSFVKREGESEAQCTRFGAYTNYRDRNGVIVFTEGSETGEEEVDNSVCCALYDPMDTDTLSLKAACEVITVENPDAAATIFYQQSPHMCSKSTPTITFLDLNGNGALDEDDEILEELLEDEDLDEDQCCMALLEDETLDYYWDYACRPVLYEYSSFTYEASTCGMFTTSQKFFLLSSVYDTALSNLGDGLAEAIYNEEF